MDLPGNRVYHGIPPRIVKEIKDEPEDLGVPSFSDKAIWPYLLSDGTLIVDNTYNIDNGAHVVDFFFEVGFID